MKKILLISVLCFAFADFSFGQASDEIPVDPDFSITIAGKSGGIISAAELIGSTLETGKPNYHVEGFTALYVHPNSDLSEKIAYNSEIPQSWEDWISDFIPGQKLYFYNILVRGDDGSIRKAPITRFIIE